MTDEQDGRAIPQDVENRIVARTTRNITLIGYKTVAAVGSVLAALFAVVSATFSVWLLSGVMLVGTAFLAYTYLNAESLIPEVAPDGE